MKFLHPTTGSVVVCAAIMLLLSCTQQVKETTLKDMGQTMHDLRVYQENLGQAIRAGRIEDALWLVQGEDSVLQVMSNTYVEHHIVNRPFSHYYKKELREPVRGIEQALRENDTANAYKHYRLLVKRCNNCHKDFDVLKQVKL